MRAERRAAQGGDLHLGSAVHMHIVICTRARMYTCMRVLVDCISARVGVGVDAGACGGGSGRPLIVCHFVPLYRCIPIYECRYVWLYTCMLVYVCVCVCVKLIYIDIYLYISAKAHAYIYIYRYRDIYIYVCICMYVCIYTHIYI